MFEIFIKYWKNFTDQPHVWFFYAFLATSTLSIRKVLYFYPINGYFNEYSGIYLYLSDIFLFLTLFTWFFTLNNILSFLSIVKNYDTKCSTLAPLQENVPRGTFSLLLGWNIPSGVEHSFWGGTFLWVKKTYQQVIHNYTLLFPLFIAIFSFISILWATNQEIALFRSMKLSAFVLMFFYVFKNVPRGTFLKRSLQIIIITGIIQSFIGIIQFFIQNSIGLLWLKESIISQYIPGIAKVIFNGTAYIRAYALFPHPNIFGGFLLFSIITSIFYFKMFHARPVECSTLAPLQENVPRLPRRMFHVEHSFWGGTFSSLLGWNIPSGMEHFKRKINYVKSIVLLIQGLALFLTFSKSAILGLFIGFFYLYFHKCSALAPLQEIVLRLPCRMFHACPVGCSTWNIPSGVEHFLRFWGGTFSSLLGWNISDGVIQKKMFHVEHFKRKIILFLIILVLFFLILKPDTYSLLFKSLQERSFYLNVSRGTFLSNPLLGIGSGQFTISMQNIDNIQSWQYQPVHNVLLLILNEFGIIMLFLFVYFLWKIFKPNKNVPPQKECSTPEGMFHVEHPTGQAWNILQGKRRTIMDQEINETRDIKTINIYFKAILLSFIFIMLFDHYFWDIQQGQILFWLLLGFIVGKDRK